MINTIDDRGDLLREFYDHVREVLSQINYRRSDMAFGAAVAGGYVVIRVEFITKHCDTGEQVIGRGRVWPLSSLHTTDSEIVQTALLAVLTAEQHEVREHFYFRGQRVFGPHLDAVRIADLLADGVLVTDKRS